MKKIILLFLLCFVQICVYAQELTVSDIEYIDEGYNDECPMIILTKEGSALNVQLMHYSAHPDTEEYVITPKMNGGSNGEPCSVSIGVADINYSETAVITTFNISFNVYGIENSSFYLSCWWFEGQVTLTEGEPLELWENKNISKDRVTYTLNNKTKTATLSSGRHVEGECKIPSELDYGGQTFLLTNIDYPAFAFNTSLTSVIIPKSVTNIGNAVFYLCYSLTDVYCYAENVPETGINVFKDCPIASATLHVPAGSIEEYKTTSPWSNFGNIVALSLDLTQIRIKDRPGETLEYIGKIGSDFDTALDSLRILKNISSEIEKEPLEVLFDYDDRLFFGIIYGDCAMYSDVLDTEGYYYLRTWYSPEEPHQPQSFLEGNPIWVYKHEHIPTPRPDGWMKYWLDTGDRTFTYYFLGGQEEIGGKVYTMLGEINSNDENELNVNHWYPIREDGGIVYTITDSLPGVVEYYYYEDYPIPYLQQGNECILYNFSAEIGDKLDKNNVVKSFDTYQLMDGTECRVLKTGTHYDLYEKLGYKDDDGTYSIIDPLLSTPIPINGHAYVNYLNAFYQDNNMLYKAPDAREGLCVNDTITTLDDAYEYARSYKADPRQEEVFAYIRQLQKEKDPVTFTEGQMATIILPTTPDASKGKYYRLDRYEDGQIVFEQELQPQAHIPYIIVPNEDFSINLRTLDLAGCYRDTISVAGISFIGSYVSETFDYPDGFYIDFIDKTPDCRFDESCVIGALRAYLLVRWDDPYNQGGTRVPPLNKRGIVLRDYGTGISMPSVSNKKNTLFDLQGRKLQGKPSRGIYIENGKKVLVK